ncbi:MAG: ABC transporter substrate-binding protein, partial [Comamonadaceae bacterium]
MYRFLGKLLVAAWLGAFCLAALGAPDTRIIRFGMTPAFLHDQHALLAEWRVYLEKRIQRPVEFVQRDRYRETMDL